MSKDVKTVSARNHTAEMDIRFKTNGEPPTNQNKSGQLPQHKTNNMVNSKKQKALEKAKAAKEKAEADKAAEEKDAGTQNQDLPDENQGISTNVVVGSKRKAIEEDIEDSGTQTSVTHMGTDGTDVPNTGISAERQAGIQLSTFVETGSSLAASVAAATNAAPVDAASIEPEVDPSLAANTNAESKEATMKDANDTESDSSDDKFCSAAEEGTSSEDGKTVIKRRKVDEWVIPNPVETALHQTMDLQGKRTESILAKPQYPGFIRRVLC
jgi:hypothetical protein